MAYEYKTPDVIHAAMLENVDPAIDQREGSVVHDLTMPAAVEIGNAYIELDAVLALGFADTTEGIYLDRRAGEHGITRKPALKAQGNVNLTGPNNTLVPAGTRLQTATNVFFITLNDVTLTNGAATVAAEAELAGASGNVASGSITALAPGNLYGIVTVTNATAFDGGTDVEDDESLLARFKDRVQKPTTSGNAAHYKQWALEVAGIGDAKVYPTWNGGGTVKVVLLDSDKTAPTQTAIDTVVAYIESQRPIGATVTVIGATELPISVTATLTIEQGADITEIKTEFTASLASYLKSLAFSGQLIRYTRIANLIIDIAGVVDYANLTINGGTANIQPTDDQVGVAGVVTFN